MTCLETCENNRNILPSRRWQDVPLSWRVSEFLCVRGFGITVTHRFSELVDGLLAETTQSEIRERIRQTDRGQKPKQAPKAERTFRTRHEAVVTVQSETSRLTGDQVIVALQEALVEASKA